MTANAATERLGASGDSTDFLFVGEALALDLVNTDIVVRGRSRDLLGTPVDIAAWWRAASERYPEAGLSSAALDTRVDDAVLEGVRAFRDTLRGIFSTVADGSIPRAEDLEALNRVLHAGYLVIGVDSDGQLQQVSGSHDPELDGLLLPIARSALTLLTEQDASRLHRCANERCVLLFYDTTKSATRRWCSVGCMNRARSSRRYRERRVAPAACQDSP